MNTWTLVSTPPSMCLNEYGWPTSEPVLCFTKSGKMIIATYEQVYKEFPPIWFSYDFVGRDVTKQITHWCILPLAPIV